MKLKSIFIIIMHISFIGTQTVPFEEPLSKSYNVESSFSIFQESKLNNQILVIDLLNLNFRKIKIKKQMKCKC